MIILLKKNQKTCYFRSFFASTRVSDNLEGFILERNVFLYFLNTRKKKKRKEKKKKWNAKNKV